jgi:hypothetical protein
MDEATRELVRTRADHRCEYCQIPQGGHELRFSVDHIIARKHGGSDDLGNLALSCLRCNLHKGTDLTAIDPETGSVVPLFNPRKERWQEHFSTDGLNISGLTPSGRATVGLLQMNAPERVQLRRVLHGMDDK